MLMPDKIFKQISYLILLMFLSTGNAFCQKQDVDFHINAHLFAGRKILKVKRDFHDSYLWVLAENNQVYRVNSLTLNIDDYTLKFAAYGNLPFIDIAGLNKDTVFIATHSTNLIVSDPLTTKLIGSNEGIIDTINSIGINNFDNLNLAAALLIATRTGFAAYDVKVGNLTYVGSYAANTSKIYEATYRRIMYASNSYDYNQPQTIPVVFSGINTSYGYYIRHTAVSGKILNTAFYTLSDVLNNSDMGNFFWGTEKGLFQENENAENEYPNDYAQYLSGIKINKVTDIFGLIRFGILDEFDNNLIKETLLIGSDNGLYFTSSIFGNYSGGLNKFSIFHYDALGNITINDICVNTNGTALIDVQSSCEDGAWIAANNGLYLVKPDYAKYLDPQLKVNAIQPNLPYPADTISKINICSSEGIQLAVNGNYTGNSIQWIKDGQDIIGATKDTLTVKKAGNYNVILYDPCNNIHIESNHLQVTVTASPVFSFNYPAKIQQCSNTPYSLKTDENPYYHYRWYTNGELNGDTTSSYVVTQTGNYYVEVGACTNSWVPSKQVEVDMVTLPIPQISADKAIYCADDVAALSVNIPADNSYNINWYFNNNILANDENLTSIKTTRAGNYTVAVNSKIASCSQISAIQSLEFTPSPSFLFNYPPELKYCGGAPATLKAIGSPMYNYRWYTDGALNGITTSSIDVAKSGSYYVEVSACPGSWVASKAVQVDFITVPLPTLKTDKPSYCIGDNATLSIDVPTSPTYTINWYKDNVVINTNQNQTSITTNVAGNYIVTVTSNELDCSQSTSVYALVFNPPPTVSVEKIVKTTLCDGQTVDLKVGYGDGTVAWSTGENTAQITVGTSGTYKATVTSAAGCAADASINVQFFPNPVLNVAGTSICTFTNKSVTLTAPGGFTGYNWNDGTSTEQAFTVTSPQTVSLTVTDVNGCQATQEIVIANECPDIHIPNTFTPNGDRVNDTWEIAGLEGDNTASVRVFNRYGNLVYTSDSGYGKSWDGTSKGKRLPAATYYYIVSAKSGKQILSGPVTIIY